MHGERGIGVVLSAGCPECWLNLNSFWSAVMADSCEFNFVSHQSGYDDSIERIDSISSRGILRRLLSARRSRLRLLGEMRCLRERSPCFDSSNMFWLRQRDDGNESICFFCVAAKFFQFCKHWPCVVFSLKANSLSFEAGIVSCWICLVGRQVFKATARFFTGFCVLFDSFRGICCLARGADRTRRCEMGFLTGCSLVPSRGGRRNFRINLAFNWPSALISRSSVDPYVPPIE